ncbi:cyclophilin-like fold protein [Larkinella sp.]|uniref:cyclophilin-like fold protein n=1 Tax=Larkinella sp. TaxID=2034517 RepID=UPI003BACC5CD
MACHTDGEIVSPATDVENNGNNRPDTTSNRLRIRIGSTTFLATLLNNPTAKAFKARLPLTVEMSELNGNEKLYRFSSNLPTNSANPGTIHTGDLMLYGSTTLVLFYKSFSTIYSYTKLGQIDNPSGLAAAVGSGNITVTYELE